MKCHREPEEEATDAAVWLHSQGASLRRTRVTLCLVGQPISGASSLSAPSQLPICPRPHPSVSVDKSTGRRQCWWYDLSRLTILCKGLGKKQKWQCKQLLYAVLGSGREKKSQCRQWKPSSLLMNSVSVRFHKLLQQTRENGAEHEQAKKPCDII